MAARGVDGIMEVFKCVICMEKVRDAHFCPKCLKLCCYECIQRWLTQSTACPHCRASLQLADVIKCRFADDVMSQLESLAATTGGDAATEASADMDDLLTKYEFVSTCEVREMTQFAWQKIDRQFRCLPVECPSFPKKRGTVYVNEEILSMLSGDFKEKIERKQKIRIDCTVECFDTVMTFVHSSNRQRPTNEELLKLLPMLHDCKLQLLTDICADHLSLGDTPKADLLALALRLESNILLERQLLLVQGRAELWQMLEACAFFRTVRGTSFGGEALGNVLELMAVLPEDGNSAPGNPAALEQRRISIRQRLATARNALKGRCKERLLNFTYSSRFRKFRLTAVNGKQFVSREVLAHASGFFHQLFYGYLWDENSSSFEVDNASVSVLKLFLGLLYPTPFGMLWRMTPRAQSIEDSERQRILAQAYNSHVCFNSNAERFVNVCRLASYYQVPGLVHYLTDVAVHCLPWRQRLTVADLFKSREIMASLLSGDSLKELKDEMAASSTVLDNLSALTKYLIIEFLLKAVKL